MAWCSLFMIFSVASSTPVHVSRPLLYTEQKRNAHPKPPGLPGITAHGLWRWVTWPYLAISEVFRRCSMGYRTVSTLARAVYGLHLINGSPVWGRLRKEMRWNVTQWGLVARRCLCRMGPRCGRRASSVNRLRWLRMVCVDIWALWRPGFPPQFLWVVSTDLIVVWRDYTNLLTVWFLGVTHYVDGSRCPNLL